MDLMLQPLRKYADFKGRARRAEYWLFILLQTVAYLLAIGLDFIAGLGFVYAAVALGLLLPSLAVAVRRLHDTNRSGWWLLLILVPLVGLVLVVFLLLPGTKGPNRFGSDPKEYSGDVAAAFS